MKSVLVTGGAGYIGSHVCKALSQAGCQPITYDNFSRGHKEFVKWGPFVQADILQGEKLESAMREYKVEAVIHMAAFAYVGESNEIPLSYYQNNLVGVHSLLKAMEKAQVKKLVFSSTCATYGTPEKSPIDENQKLNPINPYGRTKLFSEQMIADVRHKTGLNCVSLRYFNAAGADKDLEIGEWHEPETHLIPLAIEAAISESQSLSIFGNDYPTPDGTCVRDYIHVSDLARAHVLSLQHLEKKQGNFVFNLGTGKGSSIKEVIEMTERISGKKVKFKMSDRRPGDPAALVAAGKKAEQELGWKPQHSSLENIVQTAFRWRTRE